MAEGTSNEERLRTTSRSEHLSACSLCCTHYFLKIAETLPVHAPGDGDQHCLHDARAIRLALYERHERMALVLVLGYLSFFLY